MRWVLWVMVMSACVPASRGDLQVSSDIVDFGTVAQCRRSARTLVLSNVGTAALTLEVPAVEDFEISPTGALTLAPGEATSLTITLIAPDASVSIERTLMLAEKSVQLRALTTADERTFLTLDFGGVSTRGNDQRTFTISEPATFDPIDEPAFSLTKNGNEVTVTFAPTEARAYAATLNMRMENYECPMPAVLRGSGVSTSLEWTPGLLLTTTSNLSVEFTNLRTRIVRMTSVSVVEQGSSGPSPLFAVPSSFDVPEATFDTDGQLVAGRATFEFTFTPTQAGTVSARLQATTDVSEQPQIVVPVRATTSP